MERDHEFMVEDQPSYKNQRVDQKYDDEAFTEDFYKEGYYVHDHPHNYNQHDDDKDDKEMKDMFIYFKKRENHDDRNIIEKSPEFGLQEYNDDQADQRLEKLQPDENSEDENDDNDNNDHFINLGKKDISIEINSNQFRKDSKSPNKSNHKNNELRDMTPSNFYF